MSNKNTSSLYKVILAALLVWAMVATLVVMVT